MPQHARNTSLAAVAERAGVSAMTVSRVLRNSPRVAAGTRDKVLAAARSLGYAPDPHMARLMAMVRGRRARRIQSTLAVVREVNSDPSYCFVALADIAARARQHGYGAEEFTLGHDRLTVGRLARILHTRAIEGVLVSPPPNARHLPQFDFTAFSSATFGYGLATPSLHRASTNMTQGILTAIAELTARGYQRIGLVITEWIDQRADHTYTGALLYHHLRAPRANHVPLLLLPTSGIAGERARFGRWMREHRPDAVIALDAYVPEWLEKDLGMRFPDDVGLVVHDWVERMIGLAGIHHRRDQVAAAAVDLVATQLMHNEKGIPAVPRQILIPPAFIDGASIRGRPDR
jgi:LacI family transcriptional regulator